MLKRTIEYEDFNGEKVSEVFYFNISKPELIEMEVDSPGGFVNWIKSVVESNDHKSIIEQMKRIILMSYGQKSVDGKRFTKSQEIRDEFEQSAAYPVLFTELATSDDAAVAFIKGVMPKDLVANLDEKDLKPPAPPTS